MYPKRFEHLLAMVSRIHFRTWHTLQKVYFCCRKTCSKSSIPYHCRYTASFSYLQLYIPFCMISNVFCNFTPCISVNVMFLVRHFAFVVKTKSLFVPLIISSSWTKRDFLSDIFPKVQFISKLNVNLNILHIKFSLCFVFVLLYF